MKKMLEDLCICMNHVTDKYAGRFARGISPASLHRFYLDLIRLGTCARIVRCRNGVIVCRAVREFIVHVRGGGGVLERERGH